MNIHIRKAEENDVDQIWPLMKELAVFEHYINSFAITPDIVKEKGFRKNPPDFHCIVAFDQTANKIGGMLVYYFIPFTAQNRPSIYMKELYVDASYRNKGLGGLLMEALKEEARLHNCTSIKWTVAPWNEDGIRFYERLGGKEEKSWVHYEMKL